ncbi:MAG: cell division protein ZipA [Aquimonas sp.]|nr:cell division protein ZipA [Aquimonas sp.]
MDPTQLRIVLLVLGLLFIGAVYWFGRPEKPGQGRRLAERAEPDERAGPAFQGADKEGLDRIIQAELARLDRSLADESPRPPAAAAPRARPEGARSEPAIDFDSLDLPTTDARPGIRANAPATSAPAPAAPTQSPFGARPTPEFDKVLSLIVAARAGTLLHGNDIVVAAEKAGLTFGDMQIFHRLPDNRPEAGPIFSVANVVKPGHFDIHHMGEIDSPGVTFFMTLPGPLPALDAWETMLPAAQRFAELLDAVVLDDERNALGRQRIQFIRDELRAYDRERERQAKRPW